MRYVMMLKERWSKTYNIRMTTFTFLPPRHGLLVLCLFSPHVQNGDHVYAHIFFMDSIDEEGAANASKTSEC